MDCLDKLGVLPRLESEGRWGAQPFLDDRYGRGHPPSAVLHTPGTAGSEGCPPLSFSLSSYYFEFNHSGCLSILGSIDFHINVQKVPYIAVQICNMVAKELLRDAELNPPFRTAVPFWGRTTQIVRSLFPNWKGLQFVLLSTGGHSK